MRSRAPFTVLLSGLLAACDGTSSASGETLGGATVEYPTGFNAESRPTPGEAGRYVHFSGTRYALRLGIDCSVPERSTVREAVLLRFAQSVDVEGWMVYHEADFGNEFSDVEPEARLAQTGGAFTVTTTPGAGAQTVDFRVQGERLAFGEVVIARLHTTPGECPVEPTEAEEGGD